MKDKPVQFKAEDAHSKNEYTDDEVNELAEWLEDLTIRQAFFLKDCYENYLKAQAKSCGASTHVH